MLKAVYMLFGECLIYVTLTTAITHVLTKMKWFFLTYESGLRNPKTLPAGYTGFLILYGPKTMVLFPCFYSTIEAIICLLSAGKFERLLWAFSFLSNEK